MTRIFFKIILSVGASLVVVTSVANAEDAVEELLRAFYPKLIPTAVHNGTTFDTLVDKTNCASLPEAPFINDPDGNMIFAAQKAYCELVKSGISISKENKELRRYLVAGQLQRIKYIIELHSEGMYTSSSPNPTKKQWRSIVLGLLEPSSFGAVEVEIQKITKARDELKSLGIGNFQILTFIGE